MESADDKRKEKKNERKKNERKKEQDLQIICLIKKERKKERK